MRRGRRPSGTGTSARRAAEAASGRASLACSSGDRCTQGHPSLGPAAGRLACLLLACARHPSSPAQRCCCEIRTRGRRCPQTRRRLSCAARCWWPLATAARHPHQLAAATRPVLPPWAPRSLGASMVAPWTVSTACRCTHPFHSGLPSQHTSGNPSASCPEQLSAQLDS